MKVFVPMSDDLENASVNRGRLVPFNPEYLEANASEGNKPANWISDSDYTSACRRLRASLFEREYATA